MLRGASFLHHGARVLPCVLRTPVRAPAAHVARAFERNAAARCAPGGARWFSSAAVQGEYNVAVGAEDLVEESDPTAEAPEIIRDKQMPKIDDLSEKQRLLLGKGHGKDDVIKIKPITGMDFDDAETAFSHHSNVDLMRAYLVFAACSIPFLAEHAGAVYNVMKRTLGKSFAHFTMKKTFFGHFCAGETATDILPTVDRLRQSGIGSILDYAAEADLEDEEEGEDDRRDGVVSARTFGYDSEKMCDANVETFLSCIRAAAQREDGFAAVKLTALGDPKFLKRIALVIQAVRDMFRKLSKTSTGDCDMKNRISREVFLERFREIGADVTDEYLAQVFDEMDQDNSGSLDYLEWIDYLRPEKASVFPLFAASYVNIHGEEFIPALDLGEQEKFLNMMKRLQVLAEEAAKLRVRLMVDAEQTYFQPAIDHLTLNLQREYNREFPSIYNTYQCYLKDSLGRVDVHLEKAKREGWIFGAKLVRGAYMVQERKLAEEKDYEDPIFPAIHLTHQNYHRVMERIFRKFHRATVMIATHNEDSVRFAVRRMNDHGIPRDGGVYFGQLLGMCDHVSFTLGQNGFKVYKYVPYGPIDEVLPYLIRRAQENSDVLGGAAKERSLILSTLWNRLFKRRQASA